jgi:hypothetical protein
MQEAQAGLWVPAKKNPQPRSEYACGNHSRTQTRYHDGWRLQGKRPGPLLRRSVPTSVPTSRPTHPTREHHMRAPTWCKG